MSGLTADPDLLNAAEAAEVLRCSVRTVRQLTYTGGLPHLKIGRRVFYPRAAVAQWVRASTAQRPAPIAPISYLDGGVIAFRPGVAYRIPTAPSKPLPPTVLDRNGCVTVEGLE